MILKNMAKKEKKEISEKENKERDVKYWLDEISNAKKREGNWRKEASNYSHIYRSITPTLKDSNDFSQYGIRYNIFYSNVELLRSVLFNNFPKPEIKRRWARVTEQDNLLQSLYRTTSEVAERAIVWNADCENLNQKIKKIVKDYLICGRGLLWVSYEPTIKIIQNETGENYETLENQKINVDYVYWQDFLCSWARTWDDVWWIARKYILTQEDIAEYFGEDISRKIKLSENDEDKNPKKTDTEYRHKSDKLVAEVWEIWDKDEKKVYFVSDGYPENFLKTIDDPLSIYGFFPTPKPLQNIETNDDNLPIPDYRVYKEQSEQLSIICERISKITEEIKHSFLYPNKLADKINALSELKDGQGIGVEIADLEISGGLANAIYTMPLDELAKVVVGLQNQKTELVQEIYEITGIADIMRSVSNPQETATAQRIKGKFGSFRLQERQQSVQTYIKDLIRIMTEIICEHFTAEKLEEITGLDLPTKIEKANLLLLGASGQIDKQSNDRLALPTWEDVLRILRSDKLRSYTIDIETTATAFDDNQDEKQALVEYISNISSMLGSNLQMAMQVPEFIPLIKDMTLLGVRQFKAGRTLEGSLENSFNVLEQKLKMMQQQVNEQQGQGQADLAKAQIQSQSTIAKIQADLQKEQMRLSAMAQVNAEKARFEQAKLTLQAQELERKQEKDLADTSIKQEEVSIKQQEANRKEEELKAETAMSMAELEAQKQSGQNINIDTNIGVR